MIKRFTYQDCIYEVNVFNLDRQGNLWGLVDVLTPDEEGHLIDPRSLRLFHPADWKDVASVAARNNSGNQALWTQRGDQISGEFPHDGTILFCPARIASEFLAFFQLTHPRRAAFPEPAPRTAPETVFPRGGVPGATGFPRAGDPEILFPR